MRMFLLVSLLLKETFFYICWCTDGWTDVPLYRWRPLTTQYFHVTQINLVFVCWKHFMKDKNLCMKKTLFPRKGSDRRNDPHFESKYNCPYRSCQFFVLSVRSFKFKVHIISVYVNVHMVRIVHKVRISKSGYFLRPWASGTLCQSCF